MAKDSMSSNPDGRMSSGRLKFIRVYLERHGPGAPWHGGATPELLMDLATELLAEVERLRDRMEAIGDGVTNDPRAAAREAIRDPEIGDPDIVCKRESRE